VPDDAVRISSDRRRVSVVAHNAAVVDSFSFLGPVSVPATVSFLVRWEMSGDPVRRGRGREVAADHPAAFLGDFAFARSTIDFSARGLGFSSRSEPGASSERGGFAEMGDQRNGVFLT
jgi:hypothetical protein